MNKIKYLLLLPMIAILSMMASCAKDDEISLGSMKVDVKVSNITAHDVLMEFSLDNEHSYRFYSVRIYKGGNPIYVENHGYNQDNEVIMDNYNSRNYDFCVISGLETNTTYTYEVVLIQEDDRPINNGSYDGDGWGRLFLSDPSYTFTTGSPSEFDNPLSATLTTDFLIPTQAILSIKLNDNLSTYSNIDSRDFYLSESEDGTNPIYMSGYNSFGYLNDIIFEKLTPGTKYYVFVRGDFKYTKEVNGQKFEQYFDDVPLQITPNSFTTPTDYNEVNIVTLTDEFNSDTFYIGRIQFEPGFTVLENGNFSISKNADGSDPITSSPVDGRNFNVLNFWQSGLEPSTKYYVFLSCDLRINYKLYYYDSYDVYHYDDYDVSLYAGSFTTEEEGNASIPLLMTTSIRESGSDYILRFDFDKHIIFKDFSIEFDEEYLNGTPYAYDYGNIEFLITSDTGEYPNQILIKSLGGSMNYKTDNGYECPFRHILYFNEEINIADIDGTQNAANSTRKKLLSPANKLSGNSMSGFIVK